MKVYLCPECGYEYSEAAGDAHMGFAPGTRWEQVPEGFVCPDCAISYKEDFSCRDDAAA
ncbi:rubredoxin [Halopseudomonas pelagia]|uniref:Rubredoxin n=1 Tax=Halopseudomonas pelagia TaxID=553151 RepID=A0AA91U1B6_9GAMM|nr:rubredoxin [Halopseudomonas pelagia]PCC98844.1 rubredoxin [Halopseudomonas pelagia]QFY58326.1 rubredoxin [Halopseudomonas pelagia]